MSERIQTFLVSLPLTFVIYLVVVYLWERGDITDWTDTLLTGAVIAVAVAAGTTFALRIKK